MRAYQRILGIAGAAVGLTVLAGHTAWAETDCYTNAKNYYASMVSFTAYGEKVNVIDQEADGHSAVAILDVHNDVHGGTFQSYILWNPDGKNTGKLYDLDIVEGTPVVLTGCVGEYGTKSVIWSSCGTSVTGVA
ncbi:hypothetical protein OG866_19995 [Streptomyces sp. NBC_00663]|uniref:hypothetical protein n=1 Tax=Streptomyces sp. NBC_00663 TaxID=2975801 RepID=UPI002E369C9C|nr:hypothetical protein [Streptomyces sp. NBC_00663]